MLSAALDILKHLAEETDSPPLPAGSVLLADILPTLLVKLTAPWYMHRIPYKFRVGFVAASAFVSFHFVSWLPGIILKFVGIMLASVSAGFGEITFLALTSRYEKNTVSTWSSGTGGAGVFGALSYLALTSWIGLSSQTALMISSIFPIGMALSYAFLLREPDASQIEEVPKVESGYDPVEDEELGPDEVSLLARMSYVWTLLRFMIPLFIVYYTEYVINQGVSPVIIFANSPFSQRDHYVYYQFLYQIGVFISRSSVNFFPIRRLWTLPILQTLNLLVLVSHAIWHWIPNVWIVFGIIFFEGLLGGATYCNAFFQIRVNVSPKWKEFALGIASVADSFGIALAGFSALAIEPALRQYQ